MSNTTNKKMFSSLLKYWYLLVFICGICSILAPSAKAASGIEVSPSHIQLDLATDKPQAFLTYTNHTKDTILLVFSVSNSNGLEDTTTTFLQNQSAQDFAYGLSSWIGFSSASLLLNPGDKGTITLSIDAQKLSPGGHYGSVLAQIQQTPGQGNVTLKSIIATPIFVRTHTGKEYEKGSIATFSPEQDFFNFPSNFLLRFTNSGDTYLTPYGIVKIYDMWGNYVGNGIVNSGSLLILPQSLRRLEIPTNAFGFIWPGIYHATLSLHFGKTNQTLSSKTTFFSFGTLPLVQIFIVILIGVNGYLFWKKRSNNKLT